jgi:hypothetical protein
MMKKLDSQSLPEQIVDPKNALSKSQSFGLNWRRGLVAVLLCFTLVIAGCQTKAPSQFAQVQRESTTRGATPAVAKDATKGGEFNKFFPKPQAGYERVYTQEKKGFAEAKLKKDGKDQAMLAVSDTKSLPTAAAKFENAKSSIAGYPSVDLGTTQTSVLVADRYQVKVISKAPDFSKDDRVAWIQKFDLIGLSKLK